MSNFSHEKIIEEFGNWDTARAITSFESVGLNAIVRVWSLGLTLFVTSPKDVIPGEIPLINHALYLCFHKDDGWFVYPAGESTTQELFLNSYEDAVDFIINYF